MKFKNGDKVVVYKVYYPLSIDILGKVSIIEIRNGLIYLLDIMCYINKDCIKIFDSESSNLETDIYKPNIISETLINL